MKSGLAIMVVVLFLFSACSGGRTKIAPAKANVEPTADQTPPTQPSPTVEQSAIPNLQAEILDARNKTTASPIGKFDFKNYKYELPRGWQDADGKEAELVDGKRPYTNSEEEKRIGLAYVTTKFLDVTGDGQDEAIVILKIDTGGSAIPQIVYVFQWKDEKPEPLWFFRTGDRADGGLKDIRAENGEAVVELYGQDRYILGELDTMKITGDEEQLCCPTHFTRSAYEWNGNVFRMNGKRLTFSMNDKSAPPIENMGEIIEKQNSKSRK